MAEDEKKYTRPKLRQRLKEELMASDKGGSPGQWSARKSQLLVQEYEKHGGGYRGPKDDAARSLEEWTEQNWQTREGEERARANGETRRYLPEAVWERLSPEEREEADRTKREAAKKGQQHVEWPEAVRQAFRELDGASEPTREELYEEARERGIRGRSNMTKSELKQALNEEQGLLDLTKSELYDRAQELDIKGRSRMNKRELAEAIHQAER